MLESSVFWIGIENRLIALFAIWGTAALAVVLMRRDEAIRRERDFNRSLIETASSVILLLDTDGRILHYNRFTTEVTGYELPEAIGEDWLTLFAPEAERARGRRLFKECLAGSVGRDNVFPVVTKHGEQRQFSWASHVMEDENGRPIGALYIGQDITPLVEAQEQVVQSERLAAIGQTVAALSHEARNELLALRLTLHALDETVADEPTRHLVTNLQYVEGRLSRLFDDVRGFAAPIRLERSVSSVADIWRKAWESLEPKHGGKAQLVERIENVDLCCSVDSLRVEQVFRNIFENSLAACQTPMSITVSCSQASAGDKSFLRISVRDNGPGLPPEVRKRIFEPFFTTKSEGTGLGMPICKRIVEAHGGDLQLGNQTGGAEFILLLPTSEPFRSPVAAPHVTARRFTKGPGLRK